VGSIDADTIRTVVMLYRLTGTAGSAARQQRVGRWTGYDRGGHVAAPQAPDLLLGDIREIFAGLR
jgi:epoxide hydrolase